MISAEGAIQTMSSMMAETPFDVNRALSANRVSRSIKSWGGTPGWN
jgi:hypothetical protein